MSSASHAPHHQVTPNSIALDAGQSGIRAAVREGTTVVFEAEYPGALTDRPLLDQLAAVVRESLVKCGSKPTVLGIGSTGLGEHDTPEKLLALVGPLGITQVNLAHDSITSYLGALGNRPGVVTAAGTGVVTLAVGMRDVARVDGWGYLIGDAGSGFWIGKHALDAVMRAFDGRGQRTSLTKPATQEFGDLAGMYLALQADEFKVARIARWARTVSEHADAGDQVSQHISRMAGRELANSALTGLRVVEETSAVPTLSLLGNVFRNELIEESFRGAVMEKFPRAQFIGAAGTGLDGAALLGSVREDEALFSRIARATLPG